MEDQKIQKKNKNFPELEDDEDEDEYLEEDYELSAKFCPYLQARSFFQKFFPKNATLEYLENLYKNNPNFSKYHSLPDYIHLKSRKKLNFEKKSILTSMKEYQFNTVSEIDELSNYIIELGTLSGLQCPRNNAFENFTDFLCYCKDTINYLG